MTTFEEMLAGPEWMERGACVGSDPEMFTDPARQDEAVVVCRVCPVREACLHHALDRDERFGVWGGQTQRELSALRATWRQPKP